MGRPRSTNRSWLTRLVVALLFALGAAALAQAMSPASDKKQPEREGAAAPSVAPFDTSDITRLIAPEGTEIYASAGPWTAQQIYIKLKENGLDATIGSTLIVRVQDVYPPTRVTSIGATGDGSRLRVTMWLYARPGSTFILSPDVTIAHELGRVWAVHYRDRGGDGDWSRYLAARQLGGDARIGSGGAWSPEEIFADDYRLLFGSPAAIEQAPVHVNDEIPDPRTIPSLRDFMRKAMTDLT